MIIFRVGNELHTAECVIMKNTGVAVLWRDDVKDLDDLRLTGAASVFLDNPLSGCELCDPINPQVWS